MIAETVQQMNEFKKENIDSLEKAYGEKMSKIAEYERQLSEVPQKYKGKSQTFINKKKKQLTKKIDDLTENVSKWFEERQKDILDQFERMLADKKEAAQKAKEDEDRQEQESKDLADKMAS